MMMTTLNGSLSSRKVRLLKDRALRNKYVSDQIKIGLRNQLRALRDARGLTQGDLAELIGTKQSVISRMERNPVKVGIPTFLDIAQKLDVTFVARFEGIDTFIAWHDSPSINKMTPKTSAEILDEMTLEVREKQSVRLPMAKLRHYAKETISARVRLANQPSLFEFPIERIIELGNVDIFEKQPEPFPFPVAKVHVAGIVTQTISSSVN